MYKKFENLIKFLDEKKKQGICLAFSGGIDSTLLLYLCRKTDMLAVTFNSVFQTSKEINLTKKLCEKYNIQQIILDTDILSNSVISENPKDRCYHCKKIIFEQILEIAKKQNKKCIIDGTNFDDLNVYRPGQKALKEFKVISPFADFKITKQEIRDFAKECGIKIYDKPSTPCLATRFPYGTKLTKDKLEFVENGEKFLKNLGFDNCRLRIHGNIARIEINSGKFNEFFQQKDLIIKTLKTDDIKYLTLDIEGFRSGSMDV